MAPSPKQESKLHTFLGRLVARYMRFVRSSSTVVLDPPDARAQAEAAHPFIFAMWHGQFVLMPTLHERSFPVSAIIARHRDAAAIRVLLSEFHINLVYGAGAGNRRRDRGGASALRTAVRVLREGNTLAMTGDFPPGPARQAGQGIIMLAKYSGRPIVPFAVATSRFFALPTWSRFTINLPFSKLVYAVGEPIYVPADADEAVIEERRRAVEAGLNRVTERAYGLAGGNIKRATPTPPSSALTAPVREGVMLKTYRAGMGLLSLGSPLLLRVRAWQGKEDPARSGERFGKASLPRPSGPLIWFHAASVGETNAVLPVIERLLSDRPDVSVLLTTGTLTSAELAGRRLPPRAMHQFIVLDVASYVRAFLDHWKPDLAVFAESEIWPNLILESSKRGVPLALVNARMSSRSARRWRRLSGVSRPLFSRFDLVLAQNETLARTFGDVGARRVEAVGNLKVDAPPPVVDAVGLERLKSALGGRPVLVAASTHEPEEDIVAAAHEIAARKIQGLCTIIAPRHPGRGKAIAQALRAKGLAVELRSTGALPDQATDIYIADTIGELGTFYALTDVAFVGGSLIPRGGQNPVEAIGHGAVVLTGPNWTNFRDFYRALLRHKGAREVKSAEELARAVELLLTNESELIEMRQGAKSALGSLSGALARTVAALERLLPPGTGVRRAS